MLTLTSYSLALESWIKAWMNEWCIYIALYCVLLYTQSALQSCGGVSPQPPSVCSIHLDDPSASPTTVFWPCFDWACCHSFIPRRSGLKGFVGAFCQSCLPNKDTLPYFSSLGGCREVSFLWVGGGCSILMHYDLDISTLMCPPILFVV